MFFKVFDHPLARRLSPHWLAMALMLNGTLFNVSAEEAEQDFYEQALLFYQQGEQGKALSVVKTALKIKPEHLPSRILYGDILLRFGEFAAAETQFKRALKFNADTALVLPKLAQTLLIQNEFSELVDTVFATSSSNDVNFAISMYRGQAFQKLRRLERALEEFNHALTLRPNSVSGILAKASIARRKGERQEYLALLSEVERRSPSNPTLLFFKGEMARKAGDTSKALDCYDKILIAHPNYKDVQRSRAALLLETGQVEQALAAIMELLDEAPSDPFTRMLQAVAMSQSASAGESRQILNDVVDSLSVIDKDLYQAFAPIHFINGAAHFLLKEYEQAERHLKKALDIDPNNISIRELLAEIALSQEESRAVLDLLGVIPVQDLTKRSAELLVSAWFFVEGYEQAKELLLALPEELGSQPHFVKMLSTALFKLGDVQAGIDLLFQRNLVNTDRTAALMLGYHALNIRDLVLALQIANRLEPDNDKDYVVLNFIGAVYLAGGKPQLAIEYFNRAKKHNRQDLVTGLNLARALKARGELTLAKQELMSLESVYPGNLELLETKLQFAKAESDLSSYKDALTRLVELDPENRERTLEYVDVLLQANQAEMALPYIERLRQQHTFWPPGLVAHARVLIAKQEYRRAQRPLRVLFGLVKGGEQFVLTLPSPIAQL